FATHGPQVTRLAGQIADGILLANILVPSALDGYLGTLREAMVGAGRPAGAVMVSLRFEVCLAPDQVAARDVMRRRVASRLMSQYPKWEYLEPLGVSLPPAFTELAARQDRSLLPAAMSALPDEALERTVLVGSPDQVAQQVFRVLRDDVSLVTIRPHAAPGQSVGEVIRAFAEDVMPWVWRERDRAGAAKP